MLGPDVFCWQPICQVYAHLSAVIGYFKPHNLTDLKKLDELFDQVNETFETYIENLKLGTCETKKLVRLACTTCSTFLIEILLWKTKQVGIFFNSSTVVAEKLSEKVNGTNTEGIVGSFQVTVL